MDGEDFVIIASKGGAPTHPAWYLNLKANPDATVEVGDREVRVRAEEADPEEKVRLWQKMVEMYPTYDDYQRKTKREIPLLILHPVGRGRSIVKTISREDLKEKIDERRRVRPAGGALGALLQAGHLPGAIRFQGMNLIPDLLPDKTTEVVAYCSNFN